MSKCIQPSFFVVGAQKAGTTALHHYLVGHPDIFLPAIKETHFFDDGHGEYSLGMAHYLNTYFLEDNGHAIVGEVDPEYLFFPEAAARINEHFPAAKLIFVLRDPVARAYSHYQMTLSRGYERLGFAQAIAREEARMGFFPESIDADSERVLYQPPAATEESRRRLFNHVVRSDFSYVGRGFYYRQVARYLEYFPKTQMLFLLADDLQHDAARALQRVYEFLSVQEVPYVMLADEQTNQATLPRSPGLQRFLLDRSPVKTMLKCLIPSGVRLAMRKQLLASNVQSAKLPVMDAAIETHLRSIYAEDVKQLATLIGRDLSAWLPKNTPSMKIKFSGDKVGENINIGDL